MKFNELLKSLRIERGVTLRQCAADIGVDASNWSKVERGINPAPKDVEILKAWQIISDFEEKRKPTFSTLLHYLGGKSPITLLTTGD